MWLFCPNVTHVWILMIVWTAQIRFFFFISPRPPSYVVLNPIHIRCFAMRLQSKRPCCISCDFMPKTIYCFALFISLHILLLFLFFTIYMLLCCVTLYNFNFYYFALSTERTWFDYISLLIIPCITYYVTNKETLNLEPWTRRHSSALEEAGRLKSQWQTIYRQ